MTTTTSIPAVTQMRFPRTVAMSTPQEPAGRWLDSQTADDPAQRVLRVAWRRTLRRRDPPPVLPGLS